MAYQKNDYASSESRTCYRQSFSVKIISQLSFRYLNKGCLNAQNICVLQADITHFLLKVRLTNPRQKLKKKNNFGRRFQVLELISIQQSLPRTHHGQLRITLSFTGMEKDFTLNVSCLSVYQAACARLMRKVHLPSFKCALRTYIWHVRVFCNRDFQINVFRERRTVRGHVSRSRRYV